MKTLSLTLECGETVLHHEIKVDDDAAEDQYTLQEIAEEWVKDTVSLSFEVES